MAPAGSGPLPDARDQRPASVEAISALTLATHDMARAVHFYQQMGFALRYGGPAASFSSFSAGNACLNLIAAGAEQSWSWWGRVIFHVPDVDALYGQALACGFSPDAPPADATWGERYFHLTDPDGHELSFARPLQGAA
jgi:catechol 2,3-dioxygenase-like lactoylglutathione lyase family enzyme